MDRQITIESHLHGDAARTLADDVRDGLTRPFKELPPKHFYDSRGAALFDQICELPEYYPTRTERLILEQRADDIAALTGATELLELGSGSAVKTRIILDALSRAGTLRRYVPVDVTEAAVRACSEELAEEYPMLLLHGVIGDFERHLTLIPDPPGPRLVAFLGGTIGNFQPAERQVFLQAVAQLLGPEDHLLLGTDLVKDRARLLAAYDDSAGVTAQFNLNLLHVINRELGADFDPADFEHVAIYDEQQEWIEMRLRAKRELTVEIPSLALTVPFAAGEEMRTEISAKFTAGRVAGELATAGLEPAAWMTDDAQLFALTLARVAG
jgi:L-histidine N-alpha-methyltransferase